MTAKAFLQFLTGGIFLFLFAVVVIKGVHYRRSSLLHASLFSADAAAIVLFSLIPAALGWKPDGVLEAIIASLGAVLAYPLIQLVDDAIVLPSWALRLSEAGLGLSVLGLFLFHEPRPGWLTFFILAYLSGMTCYAAVAFSREAAASRGVTRRRLRAVAIGTGLLTAAIVIGGLAMDVSRPDLWALAAQLCGLGCGVGFFLGFAPPKWLQRSWEEPELRKFLERASRLPRLPETKAIVRELERGAAESLGTPLAAIGMWAEQEGMLRFERHPVALKTRPVWNSGEWEQSYEYDRLQIASGELVSGKAFKLQRPLSSSNTRRDQPEYASLYEELGIQHVLAAPISTASRQFGVLTVYGLRNLVFAEDDLSLVTLLADQAAVVLESHTLIREAGLMHAQEEANKVREKYARQIEFLAEVSQELTGLFDYERSLQALARAVIPELADWCVVDIFVNAAGSRQVVVAHVDPSKEHLAREAQCRFSLASDSENVIQRVFRTGERHWEPNVRQEETEASPDERYRQLMGALRPKSLVAVPLRGREQTLGVMSFLFADSDRVYGLEDVVLIEELTARAGLAIENALLYQEREHERDRLQQIIDALPEGIAVVDASGRLSITNAAASTIIGRQPSGLNLLAYHAPGTLRLDGSPMRSDETPLARAILHNEVIKGEQVLLQRADTEDRIPVLISAAPLTSGNGAVVGALTVFQDISQIKDLERQKDEFLSAAAHDLKTPVTSIRGFVQLLKRRARRGLPIPPEQLHETLDQIEVGSEKITALINELLDLGDLGTGRPLELRRAPGDLARILREVVKQWQRTTSAQLLHLHMEKASFVGEWDQFRLERVFGNLLANAIKYSPGGGDILVSLDLERGDEGDFASVTVRDHGIGIPQHDLPRIFERFHRGGNIPERITGTGIGLAYVRDVIERHGGHVTVASDLGHGSTFCVKLPLSPANGTTNAARVQLSEVNGAIRRAIGVGESANPAVLD